MFSQRGSMHRPFLLASLIAALLAAGSLTLAVFRPALAAEVKECRTLPDADCLIEIGVSLRLGGKPGQANEVIASKLMSVRRFKEVREIVQHRTQVGADGRVGLGRRIARIQLLVLLEQGVDLEEAMRRVPNADAGILYLTALNLLGQDVDGGPGDQHVPSPAPQEGELVGRIATRIMEMREGQSNLGLAWNLSNAANLFAAVDDPDGARRAVAMLPAAGVSASLSEEAFRVGGAVELVATLDRLGILKPANMLVAAGAAQRPEDAQGLIARAFSVAAGQTPWPDFTTMYDAVRRSQGLGHTRQSLDLARRMAVLAVETRYPFEVFGNLDAARALLVAGADRSEVSASLDRAESLFPDNPSSIAAIGLVSGPMRWGGSGLEVEAKTQLASVSAGIGDLERAKRMLQGIDEPASWLGLDYPTLPRPAADELLAIAEQQLSPHDHAYVIGQFVRFASFLESPPANQEWALRRARDLFLTGEIEGRHAEAIFTAIILAGHREGDERLTADALARMAQWALDERDPRGLVSAGILFEVVGRSRE